MSTGAKYPVLRRTLVALAVAGVLGLFFAFNYFFFIPQQHRRYNRKIFRILTETADDFSNRLDGKISYQVRNVHLPKETRLQDSTLTPREFAASFGGLRQSAENKYEHATDFVYDTVKVRLFKSAQNSKTPDSTVSLPIDSLLLPTLEQLHRSVFDLVLLVRRDTLTNEKGKTEIAERLLFKKGNVASGTLLQTDSTRKEFLQFPAVKEVDIEGARYKMFSIPFQIEGNELLLSGFIDDSDYRASTAHYSQPALLWIVSLLVLIILLLPFIKIFLLSRQERISATDVRLLIVVLVVAPFILTVGATAFQLYLLKDEETSRQLEELRKQVTGQFIKETGLALAQLKSYDSLLQKETYTPVLHAASADSQQNRARQTKNDLRRDRQTANQKPDFKDQFFYPLVYRNLDDVFWVNGQGRQIVKWFFLHRNVSYLDVSRRTYFQKMRDGEGLIYSGRSDTIRYFIEPTISWATGEYSVNVSTESHHQFPGADPPERGRAVMVGLATSLYSLTQTIVPRGFSFCIIDSRGEILFHAQTERSLHENLFDETGRYEDLIDAVQKKETRNFPHLLLYDHQVKLLTAPMKGTPFTFVSYFNKREQNLFVFHTAGFTLLCTTLALLCLLVFILLNHYSKFENTPLHFQFFESALMRPAIEKFTLYKQILLLEALIFSGWLLLFLFTSTNQDYILISGILLPFLVSTGYYILKMEYNHQRNNKSSANDGRPVYSFSHYLWRNGKLITIFYAFAAGLLFVLGKLLYSDERPPAFINWIPFLVLPILLPFIPWFILKFLPNKERSSTVNIDTENTENKGWLERSLPTVHANRHFYLYCTIILLAILLISVFPSLSILNYAVREETKAQAKAKSFRIAEQIEGRRAALNAYFAGTKLDPSRDTDALNYMARRKFSTDHGIYLQKGFSVDTVPGTIHFTESRLLPNSSDFYQLITRFLFLPRDHADFFSNNDYYWWEKDDVDPKRLHLYYTNQGDRSNTEAIRVTADIPGGSLFHQLFFSNSSGWFVFFCLLLLTVVYFYLIRTVTSKIFLLDYHLAENGFAQMTGDPPFLRKIFQRYSDNTEITDYFREAGRLSLHSIETKEHFFRGNSFAGAQKILDLQHLLTPVYERIWKSLSDEEKFILYDFSLDGFTNHKNIDIFYGLLQKGLIRKGDQNLELMSYSFRNFLLGKAGTNELIQLRSRISSGSSWQNVKVIFYVAFLAIMVFLFATQQEVSNKIIAVVTGIVTVVPLLLRLFDKNLLGARQEKE